MERLQKVIAKSGYSSRRKAEELIAKGKVTVNGETVTEMGTKVKKGDVIQIDGKTIEFENKVYYVLYKPKGMISSASDELGRPCVVDLFNEIEERVYPVGRLDYDSTGLLFMTNDGDFANLIMHPSSHLEKVYDITVRGIVTGETLHQLEKGIYLDGAKTLPCKIKVTAKNMEHKNTRMLIRLVEGKNRQVRRMFEAVGHDLIRLHRAACGGINLKGMTPGEYRILKPQEVKDLRRLAEEAKEKNKNFRQKRGK
ncbi:MAG: pseudouridine synthase [Beduini sp.]|uniref:pseudouridine synthase n=1 Tax=Beduini sp. TaxID=1922300 RepID=UPI0011C82A2A